jgi:hypothetical protein
LGVLSNYERYIPDYVIISIVTNVSLTSQLPRSACMYDFEEYSLQFKPLLFTVIIHYLSLLAVSTYTYLAILCPVDLGFRVSRYCAGKMKLISIIDR